MSDVGEGAVGPHGSDVPGVSPEAAAAIDEVIALTRERLRAEMMDTRTMDVYVLLYRQLLDDGWEVQGVFSTLTAAKSYARRASVWSEDSDGTWQADLNPTPFLDEAYRIDRYRLDRGDRFHLDPGAHQGG